MKFTDTVLSWTGFTLIGLTLLVAPWLFGSWEMWWFWPFAFLLFLATLTLALRFILWRPATSGHSSERRAASAHAVIDTGPASNRRDTPLRHVDRRVVALLLGMLPFLGYAFVRFMQAPVFMDAERSFLLLLTPFLLGLHILCGFNRQQKRMLFSLVAGNLFCLGLYGLINHWFADVPRVLWRTGYEQYAGRASGTYFCPDHFAGIMELAVCMGLAFLTARERSRIWKVWGGGLIAIGTLGVMASQSRGGGLTLIVIATATLIWGFGQWPPRNRWLVRFCALATLLIALILFWNSRHPYVTRFKNYGAWRQIDTIGEPEGRAAVIEDALRTSRGRMYGGAWRAWRSAPVFGIGPGMHQHLWFHFGPSPDGDRDAGTWPTLRNTNFHSFEVHSDWLQLLEEYGIVGFLLFLGPALALFLMLLGRLRRESRRRQHEDWDDVPGETHDRHLTGLLVWICMAFHSLGDFNLQMPATTWLFAALLALALTRKAR